MYECFHQGCSFSSSDEYYLALHQQLEHSIFHSGPMRELLQQLLAKLLAKREGVLEIKIPRSRIIAAAESEAVAEKLVSERRNIKVNFYSIG